AIFTTTTSLVIISLPFSVNTPSTPQFSTLSLHDALPIWLTSESVTLHPFSKATVMPIAPLPQHISSTLLLFAASLIACSVTNSRSEEHTSELQSRFDLVCRLLLEKKKKEHSIYVALATTQ